MNQFYKLPLILTPQSEGGFVVTCPLLSELITEGDTVQEALHNADDALSALVEAYQELGRPLPAVLQTPQADVPFWLETVVTVA